jgi:hypothetical protein
VANSKTTQVYLDRIEEEFGVLLVSGEKAVTFDVPLRLFPDGVREGTMLKMTLEVDEEGGRAVRQEVDSLMDELLARDR